MLPLLLAALGAPGAAGAALAELGAGLAQALRGDPRWQRRLRERERVCRELPQIVGTLPRAPPQLRIVPERSGAALTLACHAWGFSPPDITLRWLRNGAVVEEPRGPPRALPLGDGTFRAQVNVEVTPGTAGDTFECWALHPSLEEPVSVTWAPGLSPKLSLLVALAVLALLLGLLLFIFGLSRYLSTGYTPLPGDTHAGNI
ncbi:PREDICTED: IgG receptor FcRn large subunit p51 [Pseudopodoces humilis]|uniref:IgG receptor FcRn large subunit p51 n=1 Tax=Pseudopodoces humilis TaxID=181119 RepID=UPI0006B6E088|nr:PREDICTED: IgG receptor FcRn large subunit p51 [Pseudopodoces humilis]